MPTSTKLIQRRLSRIEGQVRGLKKMVEEDRECIDVLTQVAALRAAISSVGLLVFSDHLEHLQTDSKETSDERIQRIRTLMGRLLE